MGMYVLGQVVQWSYLTIHGNMSGSSKRRTSGTLGLAIILAFLLFLIIAMADPSSAIAGFALEQNFTRVGGNAVAIGGERFVIGAPDEVSKTGAVYVFRYNSVTKKWENEAKLVALDGAEGDQFGTSVAIAEGRIVVGSPTDSDNGFQSGSVYVFRYDLATTSWLQEQKIVASDGMASDFFGFSTAISENRVVVGSLLEGGPTSNRGAVYVYESDSVNGWLQQQKLVAIDGGTMDQLGFSVAIEGDRIVAGANQNKSNDVQTGSVYVFMFNRDSNSWELETKLTPLDGGNFDLFGSAVGINGDRVIAGTMFAGYAYVFRRNNDGWVTEQKLELLGGTGGGEFGSAVAIAGERVVVGAPAVNSRRGAVFLFGFDPVKAAWIQEQILTDSNASEGVKFGRSVAIAGERIVAGLPGSGAADIFRFTPDLDGDGVPDAQDQCPNSDIRPAVIVDNCNSGVVNALLTEPAGCTITDEILNLAVDAGSHGQFVSQVDKFLLELEKGGILEPNQKNAIKDCATQSTLP